MKSTKPKETLNIDLQRNSKNTKVLLSFIVYCFNHPEERFWQALRNWSKCSRIEALIKQRGEGSIHNTYYWEGRRGDET